MFITITDLVTLSIIAIFPGKRYKEYFFASSSIGISISLIGPTASGIKSQCSNNQEWPYKYPNCAQDQWRTADTAKREGPSSLSEKFSNDTSIMDINDGYFEDPDLDDEAESHLSMMSTVLVGFLEAVLALNTKRFDQHISIAWARLFDLGVSKNFPMRDVG
ncbi:hypothetical protein Adt_03221 [Abeliophyllum distichum]|uniref:Uncharacterized protein n=1 Tax=Abeliophyllum distichum TaxID=126358 RepID=A0ABD1W017_9LAMI